MSAPTRRYHCILLIQDSQRWTPLSDSPRGPCDPAASCCCPELEVPRPPPSSEQRQTLRALPKGRRQCPRDGGSRVGAKTAQLLHMSSTQAMLRVHCPSADRSAGACPFRWSLSAN